MKMKDTWKDAVHKQRIALAQLLSTPLGNIARRCEAVWGERDQLDIILSDELATVPHCVFLYALDTR